MELINKYLNLFKIKLTQPEFREKLTVVLLVVFLSILTLLFLRPSYTKIKTTRQKNLELRGEVTELNNILASYKEASKNYDTLIGHTAEFDALVPQNPEPSSFLNKLNYLSLKSSVFLGKTNLVSQDSGVEKREFGLRGDFEKIEDFFTLLYSDARLYQVEEIKLSKKESRSKSNFDLDLTILVNAYYE